MKAIASDIESTNVIRSSFSSAYSLLRQREKRFYSNDELRKLPRISRSSPHYSEWKLRAQSARRLLAYLEEKYKPLQILEVGCGNGWLSNKMASIPGCNATGIDPHHPEIRQAREVFKENKNLGFSETELLDFLPISKYDLIVFAASLQYFGNLDQTISHCFSLLNSEGEIHILDTAFYSEEEIRSAAQRSVFHFNEVQVPEMKDHYHHHSRAALESFKPEILYTPKRILSSLGFSRNPFPWIRIKK